MIILLSVLIFILGACVGSFLNVVIYRLPRREDILRKRSYCPNCKKRLAPIDLIPIASFLILRGKCKTCGKPISLQYPIVEIITASLFLFNFINWWQNFGLEPEFLSPLFHQFFIISVLILVFVIDAKHGIIPDQIVKVALITSAFFILANYLTQITLTFFGLKLDSTGFGNYLLQAGWVLNLAKTFGFDLALRIISAAGVMLFFGLLILITRGRGMGLGDLKLGIWLGIIFPPPQIFLVIFSSFVVGAGSAIVLLLARKKKFGQTIPFGPFLAIGSAISLFFGEILLSAYLAILK